jgi:pseudaminic acid cytidylyltransferase
MNAVVIPARGGSKRIPKKNIIDFCGKPMIAWSIESALQANIFDKVIVSTDNEEIADVSKKYGAEVPFIRPQELSDDYTGTIDVIEHSVRWLLEQKLEIENICCLYATAPFVSCLDLRAGLEILRNSNSEYVFAATDYGFPIQRSFFLNANDDIEMFYPEHFQTRSQDLVQAYHDAGQFYWGKASSWLLKKEVFTKNSRPIFLPRYKVQDIDTYEDLQRAKLIFNMIQK